MFRHFTKVLASAALAAALLSPVAFKPAQARAAELDGSLVHNVQFYPYGPGYYGRGFYGRGYYGPGFYRRGFYGPAFYGRGFYGPRFYGRGPYGRGFYR